MKFNEGVYDWRQGIDSRAIWALRAVHIEVWEVLGWNGRLKGACLPFTFTHVSREHAKQTVTDFLEDEYGAENIHFYADPKRAGFCYAQFDWNQRKVNRDFKDSKGNDRRSSFQRQAGAGDTGRSGQSDQMLLPELPTSQPQEDADS